MHVRPVLAIALLVGFAPLAPALAPQILTGSLTLVAPEGVGVTSAFEVAGRFRVEGRGVPDAIVDVSLGEDLVGTGFTDGTGSYRIALQAPAFAGVHAYVARAQGLSGLVRGESPPANVHATFPPEPPQGLSATTDGTHRRVSLAWSAPAQTHGAPLQGYVVERYHASTGWRTIASPSPTTLAFDDASVAWENAYAYRVRARTYAGDSVPTPAASVTLPAPTAGSLIASVPWATVCDARLPRCETWVPGTYDVEGADLDIRGFVGGTLLTTGGEGMAHVPFTIQIGVTTPCAACSPTSDTQLGSGTTLSDGRFSEPADTVTAWSDLVLGECRIVALAGTVNAAGLSSSASASFTFCRVA